jgi:type III pantothenate kinase
VLDEKGRFIGGAIYPGVGISLEALSTHTALLPNVEMTPPRHAISASTADCMKSGILYGSAGAVDGILDQFEKELSVSPASIVATGGMAHLIAPYCRHALILDETLLLRGLKLIWDKNQKTQ